MFASLVVAAFGALPLLTPGVAAGMVPDACARQYTVQSGDTCNSIGAKQHASTYQIMAINYPTIDYSCSNLMPGQSICLGTEGADCQTTYVVAPGDTCMGIESKQGINATQLYHDNPNIDENCFNIYSGEVLCVASDYTAPTPPPDFFKNQTITTNSAPQPNTPYVPPPNPAGWEMVDSSDVGDDQVPYCDEVGAY